VGAPPVDSLNVDVPEFFKGLDATLKNTSLDDLKTYLEWKYLNAVATELPAAFDNEHFEFFEKILSGRKEQQPRWKRCVTSTDADLGEALGQKYIELAFAGGSKERTLQMVHEIFKAMEKDIHDITWMTPETKKRAYEKLHAVANKIGYPEKWRDYTALKIQKGDPIGNSLRANEFEH